MRLFEEKRVTRPRKNYFNLVERSKRATRVELRNYYNHISSGFEEKCGLKLKKIELIDKNRPTDDIEIRIIENQERLTNKDIELYKTKETTNLADKSFQKFIDSGANFPTLFKTKKYQLRLNNVFKVYNNEKGYFFSPEEKITFYLSSFKHSIVIDRHHNEKPLIMIRLAADGTQIGRNLTVLNISFSFLNKIKYQKDKSEYSLECQILYHI